ncbi:MAG: alpha/beta fold hydrolase [Propionivibrio sp.]|nr:alpha/beta fold hydrolase [Propionivibrio sp.]
MSASGEAGAPTFFFLHGWGDVGASFQFAVDALQGNWRIIAPDWRGFGQSQWNEGPYVFADYIADLDALLTHYSPVQPVQIAGHSLGGIVASSTPAFARRGYPALPILKASDCGSRLPAKPPDRFGKWLQQQIATTTRRSVPTPIAKTMPPDCARTIRV